MTLSFLTLSFLKERLSLLKRLSLLSGLDLN